MRAYVRWLLAVAVVVLLAYGLLAGVQTPLWIAALIGIPLVGMPIIRRLSR